MAEKDIEWRVVPDFPLYEINALGELRRISDGFMMVLAKHRNSYSYTLQGKFKYTMRSAPRLLKSAFPEIVESGSDLRLDVMRVGK